MADVFFTQHLDYVFFVYGLSFFVLAATSWSIASAGNGWLCWRYLALFGIIHGSLEWLDMLAICLGDAVAFKGARIGVLIISFIALLEFARAGALAAGMRRPGAAATYPVLLALAALGAFDSLNGLNASSRLALAVPAGFWSAWMLWRTASLRPQARTVLRLAGGCLALYALAAGLVTPKASFFPASWINQEAFFALAGFPVQLVRAALAAGLAVAAWRLRGIILEKDAPQLFRYGPVSSGTVLFGGLAGICLAGWCGAQWIGNMGLEREQAKNQTRLELSSRSIEAPMETADLLLVPLAAQAGRMLEGAGPGAVPPELVGVLADTAGVVPGSTAYFMDGLGTVLAAAGKDAAFLTGNNYSFRPYFTKALAGGHGRTAAMGFASAHPGYYTALPVTAASGRILGVAVIKVNLDKPPSDLSSHEIMCVVDENGVVLASSREDLVLRPLFPIPEARPNALGDFRQYPRLGDKPVIAGPVKSGDMLIFEGRLTRLSRVNSPFGGLALVSLSPAEGAAVPRLAAILETMLASLLFIVLILIHHTIREKSHSVAESERRYRHMFQRTLSVQLLLDRESGALLDINEAAAKFYGLGEGDLAGLDLTGIDATDEQTLAKRLAEAGQGAISFDSRHVTARGMRDVEVFAGPIRVRGRELLHLIVQDVTERRLAEEALRQSDEKYRRMVETANEGVCELDADWRVVFANRVMAALLAGEPADILGRALSDFFFEADKNALTVLTQDLVLGQSAVGEHRLRRLDGSELWAIVAATPDHGQDGSFKGSFLMLADISQRKRAELEVAQNAARFRALFNATSDSVFLLNRSGIILDLNYVAAQRRNQPSDQLIGVSLYDTLPEPFATSRRKNVEGVIGSGQAAIFEEERGDRNYMIRIFPIFDESGAVIQLASFSRDITERKSAERKLTYQAFHDNLTGLNNRAFFLERLTECIAQAEADSLYRYAMVFFDMDNFKLINDSFGHLVGDQMLRHLSARLSRVIPENALLARFGGDEFAVVFTDVTDQIQVLRNCDSVHKAFKDPFRIGNYEITGSCSMGVVYSKPEYKRPDQVMRDADIAMYQAKRRGPGTTVVYDHGMHGQVVERLSLEHDLRRAVAKDELYCVYQPIFTLPGLKLSGFETLIRWNHAEKGDIPPATFIPIAEETGLIVQIGRFVLGESIRQMILWRERGLLSGGATVSVNLSGNQFFQSDLVGELKDMLAAAGLSPEFLKVEITESILMENMGAAVEILSKIRGMGVKTSLDDFGTGYSSLGYIRQLPLDTIKIDRAFISQLDVSAKDAEIVRLIVEMAHTLDLDVVVEGIEKKAILDRLKSYGCDMAQGFLLARPGTVAEIDRLLDSLLHAGMGQ